MTVKPYNKAYTTLHNWRLRLDKPEFNYPLKPEVIEQVIESLDNWELVERQNLKRLDNLVWLLRDVYVAAKAKGIEDVEWLVSLRKRFINKCIGYFNHRLEELRSDVHVQLNNLENKTLEETKVVNVSTSHLKKYEERIKIYSIWQTQ